MTHERLWRQLLRWLVSAAAGRVRFSKLDFAAERLGDETYPLLPSGSRRPSGAIL